ncbi:hypothetical protein JL720_13924 [Aureococcus anophagefferens]|nr:hypothetical protein JL720_13924 [Aureococcus anophagefferens]
MSERPLYEKADAVVRVLDGVAPHRPGGSVARAVEDAYVALYEHGLVALDDVAYAQLWLADLYAVGLALPKLRRHKARHRPDAEIAGLREELAALKGDGSDMTGLPAVLRDFTPLAMVDDVAAIADGPELEAAERWRRDRPLTRRRRG